jgi:predicted benzoate:H+ symporter BenE
LRVGFSAGIIGGAVCLYATRRKAAHPPAEFSRLFRLLWMPVAGAILGGVLLPLGFSRFDPARFSEALGNLLTFEQVNRFRQVWWIHVGLYAGLVFGLAAMILRACKHRRIPTSSSSS